MVDSVVIGGNGFIGRHLVRNLVSSGRRVRVVSRSVSPGSEAGIEYTRASVSDPVKMREALAGAREVFYLAMGGGDSWADFERDYIQSARTMVELCQQTGAARMVYTSSIAALYLGGRQTVTDHTPCDPQPMKRSFYSRAKASAEAILKQAYRDKRFPVVIVRPALVVGRGGMLTHGGLGNWASDLCCIGWGAGDNGLPFVLASDVATATVAAMEVPGIEGRVFNLAGDVRPSALEFIAELRRRSRRNYQFYPRSTLFLQSLDLGKWLVKAVARKPENPLPSYRDLQSRTLRAPLDCSGAKETLQWKVVSDPQQFYSEAIDVHLDPFAPGDLRLAEWRT